MGESIEEMFTTPPKEIVAFLRGDFSISPSVYLEER